MARLAILDKINQAAKDWERTRNPAFKKEWYRLIRVYSNIIEEKKEKNLRLFGKGATVLVNPGKNV